MCKEGHKGQPYQVFGLIFVAPESFDLAGIMHCVMLKTSMAR